MKAIAELEEGEVRSTTIRAELQTGNNETSAENPDIRMSPIAFSESDHSRGQFYTAFNTVISLFLASLGQIIEGKAL